MTKRFGLSVVIIYCAKQWEGAPSAAAHSIISCAIASIGAKSFTGDGLSSTKEREAEARRYASVPLATVGQIVAINGPAAQDANSLSKNRRETGAIRSRRPPGGTQYALPASVWCLTTGSHLAWRARRTNQGPVLVWRLSSLNNCLDQL
jgi:hypothetical protein